MTGGLMAIVAVKVNGKEYHIACDDGQEQHVFELSQELNTRVQLLAQQVGPAPETLLLLLTGLTLMDELTEAQTEVRQLEREVTSLARDLRDERAEAKQPASGISAEVLEQVTERIDRIADRLEMR